MAMVLLRASSLTFSLMVSQVFILSCSPPKLVLSAQQVECSGRFGDDAAPPPASTTVRLSSAPDGKNIPWTATCNVPYVRLEQNVGGTPCDLKVSFDLQSMPYGVNAAAIELVTEHERHSIAIQYTLLEKILVNPGPTVTLTGKFGDPASEPVTTVEFKVGSDADKRSIRWKAACAAAGARLSDVEGGTPSRLVLSWDPQAMRYGANAASIELTSENDRRSVAIQHMLLGKLVVRPDTTIELMGRKGDAKSLARTIELSSPGKDGLKWSIQSEDPWILVEPSNGLTPATVAIAADLGRVTRDISGRIVVIGENTWVGSPMALPIAIRLLDPALVRRQLTAKQERNRADMKGVGQGVARLSGMLQGEELADVDAVVTEVKEYSSKVKQLEERITPSLDDLEAFLDQNADYAAELEFERVRKEIAGQREDLRKSAASAEAVTRSLRDVRGTVKAYTEWQALEVDVSKGDQLLVRAEGTWTLGLLAGSCDAEGMGGSKEYCILPEAQFGCLLVSAGDNVILSGEGDAEIETGGGRVVARCNDRDFSNNSGSIGVRLVAFALPK